MIIDSHTHAYTTKQLKDLKDSMHEAGIDKSIILYWPFRFWTRDIRMPSMGELLGRMSGFSGFYLVGSVSITDKKLYMPGLKELEKLLSDRKIIGIKLYPGYEHFYPNDPRTEAVYRLCLKYDVPVMFHSGDCWINEFTRGAMLKFSHPLNIDEVAVKYPGLKIIICHLGNPWTADAAAIIAKNKNVYADISGMLSYDRKSKRNDDQQVTGRIMDAIAWCNSADKLIFGTDCDIFDQKEYLDFVKSLKVDKKELKMMLCDNAKKVFRI